MHGVKPKPRETWDTKHLVSGSKIPTVADLDSPHVMNSRQCWILHSSLCQGNSDSTFQ